MVKPKKIILGFLAAGLLGFAPTFASAATTVGNNVSVGGTLGVTGATTLASTLSAGASTLASAVVTGNATIGGTLGVTGATTLSGTLSAGASTLASAVVTGNASVGGTLDITGLASLGAGFISNASSTINGDFTTTGNATTTGNIYVGGYIYGANGVTATIPNLTAPYTTINFATIENQLLNNGVMTVSGASTLGNVTASGTVNINTTGNGATQIGTNGSGLVRIGNSTGNTTVNGGLNVQGTLTATTFSPTVVSAVGNVNAGNNVNAANSLTAGGPPNAFLGSKLVLGYETLTTGGAEGGNVTLKSNNTQTVNHYLRIVQDGTSYWIPVLEADPSSN